MDGLCGSSPGSGSGSSPGCGPSYGDGYGSGYGYGSGSSPSCGHDHRYIPPVLEGKTLADLDHPRDWGDLAEVLFRLAGWGVADSFTPGSGAKPIIWRLLAAAAWGALAVEDRDEGMWESAEMMALGALERFDRRKRAMAAAEEFAEKVWAGEGA